MVALTDPNLCSSPISHLNAQTAYSFFRLDLPSVAHSAALALRKRRHGACRALSQSSNELSQTKPCSMS